MKKLFQTSVSGRVTTLPEKRFLINNMNDFTFPPPPGEPQPSATQPFDGTTLPFLGEIFLNATNGMAIAELIHAQDGTPADVRFLAVNKAFETHTGLPASELPGKLASEYLPDFHTTPLFKMYSDVVHQQKRHWVNHHFPPLQRHWHINAYPLEKRNCFATDVVDITPVCSERRTRDTTHKLFNISLNAISDILLILTPDGSVINMNNAARQYFQIKGGIVEGSKCYELHQQQAPCRNCPLKRAANEQDASMQEIISPINHRYYECTAHPVSDEGSGIQYIVMRMHDISARKEREFMLEEARRRAENADRIKSEFLSNTSHELRTPLNAIIGFSQLLMEEAFDSPHDSWVELIHKSGKSLLSIVNNLLTFSHVERKSLDMLPQKVEFRTLVEKSVSLAGLLIDEKDIHLSTQWDRHLPKWIHVDAFYLNQLLFGVLENAVKFTEKGSVLLSVAPVRQGSRETVIRFIVSDTGGGIPSHQVRHIFTPFMQGDGSARRKHGGLGIGLPVAKALAECMGGGITCVDTSPAGTTFEIVLPLKHASETDGINAHR